MAAAFGATVLHLSFSSLSIISLGFLVGWIAAVLQARQIRGASSRDTATAPWRGGTEAGESPPAPAERTRKGEPVATALAAEIVGLYRLVHMSKSEHSNVAATPEYKATVERIVRLLELVAPENDSLSVLAALESGDPRLKANGIEYLDNILKPEYRKFLVPLLELES